MRSFHDSNARPSVTSVMVMQSGTGQTAEHRLQPMHSLSSTHTMCEFFALPAARAWSRVGARWPGFSGSPPLWMHATAESLQAT